MYKYVVLNGDVYIRTEPRVQVVKRIKGLIAFVQTFVGKVKNHV